MSDNQYMRDYMLKRYHNRRKTAIEQLGGKCVSCGSKEELEVDHINPQDKKFCLSKLWSVNEKTYQEELSKCQLLCKVCHNNKTTKEKSVEHGGGASGKRNCKCSLCKAKKAEYMKNYKKKSS